MSSVVNYRTEYSDRLRAEVERRNLLKVAASRGVELTEQQRARVEGCSELDVLGRWFDQALTASTAAEIFE